MDETQTEPTLMGEASWLVAELAHEFAPAWHHPNKLAIAHVATPEGAIHTGTVSASRWRGGRLPDKLTVPAVCKEAGFFQYGTPSQGDQSTHWHLNFADPYLFGFGEGALLAQDELQIVEHPCLASIAYAIEKGVPGVPGLRRRTMEEGTATPVLIEGAPRRCTLDTNGIYGDYFAMASPSAVAAATRPLDPPTRSNILALAALRPARGAYTRSQIRQLFETAYTGFRAIVIRSGQVALHTGYWGCGAFGGNKGLVSAIQLLAAGAAGVERVHFWWGFTPLDSTAFDHASAVASLLSGKRTDDVIGLLSSAGYHWGSANENYVPFSPPFSCLLGR